MAESTRDRLLADIEAFLIRTGIAETTFGVRAMKEPNLLKRLRAGKNITIENLDRIRAFMAAQDVVAAEAKPGQEAA